MTESSTQMVFDRYEIKYMLNHEQKEQLMEVMEGRMALDRFGRSTIRNLYYDTEGCRLIRRSLEKPIYKEKLRVRSYKRTEAADEVFVEIKKKYNSVVNKRRVSITQESASAWLDNGVLPGQMNQISKEIEYFRGYYRPLAPRAFISSEREAFYPLDGGSFRLTLDENVLARTDRLSLCEEAGGKPLLAPETTLLELKTDRALPLWITSFLTKQKLYPTSFSKYGTAYLKILTRQEKGEN